MIRSQWMLIIVAIFFGFVTGSASYLFLKSKETRTASNTVVTSNTTQITIETVELDRNQAFMFVGIDPSQRLPYLTVLVNRNQTPVVRDLRYDQGYAYVKLLGLHNPYGWRSWEQLEEAASRTGYAYLRTWGFGESCYPVRFLFVDVTTGTTVSTEPYMLTIAEDGVCGRNPTLQPRVEY